MHIVCLCHLTSIMNSVLGSQQFKNPSEFDIYELFMDSINLHLLFFLLVSG